MDEVRLTPERLGTVPWRVPAAVRLTTASGEGAQLPASVLCIEENPLDVKLLEGVLRVSPGVKVMSAMQGRLGLDLAREHRPEVVIVDVNLPDMGAESVVKLLKSDPRTNPSRIVVTTDDPLRTEAMRLRAAGAYAYLAKPLDVGELIGVLRGG